MNEQRTMFPNATPADVRLEDKIIEIERELDIRRRVYPKWLRTGKINREHAHRRIITLEAILADYRRQIPTTVETTPDPG